MIEIQCMQCGKIFNSYPSKNRKFCSFQCSVDYGYVHPNHHRAPHLSEYNRLHNKDRMTSQVKEKLRRGRLKASKGTTYTKFHGRHEHRIVAEWLIGRALKKGEVVHHVDGNKRNNSPSNLMVFRNQGDHTRYHKIVEGGGCYEVLPTSIPTIFD